ncbi:MAG: hypothetical protein ACLTFE_05010 [Coprococcus eutactus]
MNDLGNKQTTVCSDYLEAVKSINTDKALSNTERLSACIEELNKQFLAEHDLMSPSFLLCTCFYMKATRFRHSSLTTE